MVYECSGSVAEWSMFKKVRLRLVKVSLVLFGQATLCAYTQINVLLLLLLHHRH